jgi:hypothetical protein
MSGAIFRDIEILGSVYRARFSFATMRMADEVIPGGMESNAVGAVTKLSALFWASLQAAHRITREGSDNLIDEVGLEKIKDFIGEAMSAYNGASTPADAGDEGNAPAPAPVTKKK